MADPRLVSLVIADLIIYKQTNETTDGRPASRGLLIADLIIYKQTNETPDGRPVSRVSRLELFNYKQTNMFDC